MKQGLLEVRAFRIQSLVITRTIEFLQEVGASGFEGFALWGGTFVDKRTFRFVTCIIPEQKAMMTSSGLLVTVSGEALFAVNKLLHERSEILGAQVHSHPTSAYHSDTDDTYPLATLVGSLSIVLPDFARNSPKDIDAWAWYRLSRRGMWDEMTKNTNVEIE